jgi:hypothetical protein
VGPDVGRRDHREPDHGERDHGLWPLPESPRSDSGARAGTNGADSDVLRRDQGERDHGERDHGLWPPRESPRSDYGARAGTNGADSDVLRRGQGERDHGERDRGLGPLPEYPRPRYSDPAGGSVPGPESARRLDGDRAASLEQRPDAHDSLTRDNMTGPGGSGLPPHARPVGRDAYAGPAGERSVRPSLPPPNERRASLPDGTGLGPRPAYELPTADDRAAAVRRERFGTLRSGLELGPDAYRDDGHGAASDRHGFRPDRGSLEPRRDVWEQDRSDRMTNGLGYSSADPLDRSRGSYEDSLPSPADARSERPGGRSHPDSPGRGYVGAVGDGMGPVPGHSNARDNGSQLSSDRDDDTLTRPLPVILPGASALPRPSPVETPRGPFEPARPSRPVSITGSVEPPPATFSPPVPPRSMPEAAAAKLDQIKDLYLTAEAIGEDALDKHFDQVSQRQRELIREFFERSKPTGSGAES